MTKPTSKGTVGLKGRIRIKRPTQHWTQHRFSILTLVPSPGSRLLRTVIRVQGLVHAARREAKELLGLSVEGVRSPWEAHIFGSRTELTAVGAPGGKSMALRAWLAAWESVRSR
jgi:hypothetical protein